MSLPTGWIERTLGEVCEVNPVLGLALDDSSEVSFVPMAAVEEETGRLDPSQVKSFRDLRGKSYRPFMEGDVLVAKITPSMENGKGAVASHLRGGVGFGSTEFHILRPRKGVEPWYILRFILQPRFRQGAARAMTGTAGQLRVPARFLRDARIPLPPPEVQRRIVEAIEEQFSRLDAAEASLVHNQVRLDRYMRLLIHCELQGNWPMGKWGEVGGSQNGRAFPSKDYRDDGIPLLRPGNLHRSGAVEWTDLNTRRLPETYAEEYPAYVVGPRELVMNLTAQSLKDEFLGRICITGDDDRCLLNQRIARLTPSDELDPKFAFWVFKSPTFRQFVESLNTGSLIQHMFTSQLAAFEMPLPPLAEQVRIVERIEQHASVAAAVGVAIVSTRRRLVAMRRAILRDAFAGRLVSPDTSDESVSKRVQTVGT